MERVVKMFQPLKATRKEKIIKCGKESIYIINHADANFFTIVKVTH